MNLQNAGLILGGQSEVTNVEDALCKAFKEKHGREPNREEKRKMIQKYKHQEEKEDDFNLEEEVCIVNAHRADSMFVAMSNRALGRLQQGYSFPMSLVSGDKKLTLVLISQKTLAEKTQEFIEIQGANEDGNQ